MTSPPLWPFLAQHLRTAAWLSVALALLVAAAWAARRVAPALRSPRLDRALMPLAVLAHGVAYTAWGEKCSHQSGWGWDGIRFGNVWARDFHKVVLVDKLNHYYLQKSLPSGLVHYAMRAVGAPFTDKNIILAFGILDVASWTFAAFVWARVTKRLGLSRPAAWLGYVLLFFNQAGLKQYFWNPVLVDSTGLMIASAMLLAHLARWSWLVPVLGFLGGFVIPGVLPLMAGLLACFAPGAVRVTEHRAGGVALALAGALVVVRQALAALDAGLFIGNGAEQVSQPLLPLSAAALVLYLVLLSAPLASFWPAPRALWASLRLRHVPAVALMAWGIHAVVDRLKNTVIDVTPEAHYHTVLMLGVAKPMVSLVAHTVFLGPALLLCIVLWREHGRAAWELGPGVVLTALCGFVLSVDDESRHLLFFLPVWATTAALAFDRAGGARRPVFVVVVAALALLLSKAWLPLETPPLAQSYERLFMSLGPWMTMPNWALQGAATLAAGVLLTSAFRRPRRSLVP